jgi:citrate lyase subunit beta/citryl-CoA lyase
MNSEPYRTRRSVLYMPGANARAMDKARQLAADALIFDLEDAVAPEAKNEARDQVLAALGAGGYGNREVVVRVNALDTPWADEDLKAAARSGCSAVLLPKVECASTISGALRVLEVAGAPADLPVWIMTETPRGVLNLDSIISEQPRLQAIVMGTSDLARDLRISAMGKRTGLLHALSHSVLVARAHGIDIIDGVHLALDDPEGYRLACEQGRELGFDGKSLIHPRQIETANEIFGVSDEAAELAREIVTAWESARAEERGITVVRGQLIEQLHVDDARRILALHKATRI